MDFNPRYALMSVSLTLLYFAVTLAYVYTEVSQSFIVYVRKIEGTQESPMSEILCPCQSGSIRSRAERLHLVHS